MTENNKIYLSSPHMSDEGYEMEYINHAFETNWIAPLGPNVDKFEQMVCETVKCKSAVALSAGTAAVHLALKLAGVSEEDVVFCQSLTFSATANPIMYENAVPVFIDSDLETWNMSSVALEAAFEKYKKLNKMPKAVLIVHLYGLCANMDELIRICAKYNTPIIEDAAESLGSIYKGKMTGTFGDYAILSFNGNKIITTSGGGMLLCNREDAEEKAKKALFWATQARDPAIHYQHSELGYNYRMSNIAAGIGCGQMKVLSDRVDKKREIFDYYSRAFSKISDICMMPVHEEYQRSNCWLSCMTINEKASIKPADILNALGKENIEARPIWKPMHLQPFYSECDYIDNNGASEHLFNNGVCLPSDTKMTDADLKKVCDIVLKLWDK